MAGIGILHTIMKPHVLLLYTHSLVPKDSDTKSDPEHVADGFVSQVTPVSDPWVPIKGRQPEGTR